jgi:hypothetical protein
MADNLDPEYLRDLEASLQASREALDDWTTELLGGTRDTEEERKTRISNNRELAASNKSIAEEKKRREDNIDALKKFGSSLLDTSKQVKDALLSTEGGMSKYNKSISSVGDAALTLGKQFGVFGTVLGGIAKLFTLAAEIVTEGNERLIKSYNSLGEIGATASLTTDDLLKFATTAGYGTRNLEGLIKPVKSLGTGLIALGGSTGEGIKKFAELAATTEEQRAAYRRLGLSQEEVTQLQADSIKTTTNASLTLAKSVEKQRKSADEYIESMVLLSSLTGTTIKEQQEARDKALAQENFNAYLFAKGKQRDELQNKAEAEKDLTKKASLQAEADRINAVIKSKTEFGQLAMSTRDAKTAAGMLELASTDNASVFTSNSAAILNSGFGWQRLMNTMNKGGDVYDAYMEETAKAVDKFTKQYGEGAYAYGQASRELQQSFGIDNDARKLSTLYAQRNTEEGKKAYELQKKQLADKMKGLGKEDPTLKAENARLEAEKNTQFAMDALFKTLQDFVNPALLSFYESITEIVDWIVGFIPGGKELGSDQDKKRREYKKAKEELALADRLPDTVLGIGIGNNKNLQQYKENQRDIVNRYEQKGIYSVSGQAAARSSLGVGSVTMPPDAAPAGSGSTSPSSAPASTTTPTITPKASSSGSSPNTDPTNTGAAKDSKGNDATSELAGLPIKGGLPGQATLGGSTNPGAAKLAKEIYQQFGGSIGMFTGFNDQYHHGLPYKSQHTTGNAFDFSLKNPKEAAAIANAIRSMPGTKYVQDEYNKPSSAATGGHIHVGAIPQAREGGIFSGSNMGFPVELHGNELVAPLDPNSILAKMLTASPSEAASMMNGTGSSGVSTEMIEAMINKFNTMISYLSEGVDIQQKILRQS